MKAKALKGFDCLYRSSSGGLFYNIQLESKKPSGSFKRKMVNLDTDALEKAVREIRKRKLFKKFNGVTKKENFSRMRLLEDNLREYKFTWRAKDSLKENVELFCWGGFKGIKLLPTSRLISLEHCLDKKTIVFNPRWVNTNNDLSIIRKLRTFIY